MMLDKGEFERVLIHEQAGLYRGKFTGKMGNEQIFAAIFDYGADANIRASRAPPNINALCSHAP